MPVTLICVICQKQFSVIPSRVKKGAKYCSYHCHQIGEGRKSGAIRAEQKRSASTGKSYPKIHGRHHHRTVAEQKLGRPLLRGEIVHHKDGNKQNFREDNLDITTQGHHIRQHIKYMIQRRKEIHGY